MMDYKLVDGNFFTPSQMQKREEVQTVSGFDIGTSPMTQTFFGNPNQSEKEFIEARTGEKGVSTALNRNEVSKGGKYSTEHQTNLSRHSKKQTVYDTRHGDYSQKTGGDQKSSQPSRGKLGSVGNISDKQLNEDLDALNTSRKNKELKKREKSPSPKSKKEKDF